MEASMENPLHAQPTDLVPETQKLTISGAIEHNHPQFEQLPVPTSTPAHMNGSSIRSTCRQSPLLESPMPPKRKRNSSIPASYLQNFEPPYTAATAEEKRQWTGFCEIESEPAIFNLMLKEFGVQGVKIQEVLGLDADALEFLPQPVYGLIFLFRYRAADAGSQDETCPGHVWFANQVAGSSCASTALLNMVYNIESIELGEELKRFKDDTKLLTPARRGLRVSKFEWVRAIHNSFARKIDMLNYDAIEEDEYGKRHKKPRPKKTPPSRSKKANIDDSAFHFVSYMPIQNEIWRLDGLDVNPQKIGPCGPDNWLDLIIPVLQARMENALEFSLLALVRDPYATAIDALAYNIKFHLAIEEQLGAITSDWRAFADDVSPEFIFGPSKTYRITDTILERTEISENDKARLRKYDEADGLLRLRRKNTNEQERLRMTLIAEKASAEQDEEKAKDRRNDYGPLIQTWLMMLAENGRLRELHEALDNGS